MYPGVDPGWMWVRFRIGTVAVVEPDLALLPLPLTQRLSVRHWITVDIVVAALMAVAAIAGTAAGLDGTDRHDPAWQVLRVLLILMACVALPYRPVHPKPVLAVIALAVGSLVIVGPRGPMVLALVLAIYTVASVSPPQASLWAAGLATAEVLGAAVVASGKPSLAAPPLILVGWLAGENTRTRRAYFAG